MYCQAKILKNLKKLQIFFTREVDIGNMAKKKVASVQQGIRFPRWMYDHLQAIADKQGATFTDVVLDLLRQELREMGITMGIGREATGKGSEMEPDRKQAE
jgi:N-acyl-D-aspartate/D-glutamate deacylase